jgi:hypothetical protein
MNLKASTVLALQLAALTLRGREVVIDQLARDFLNDLRTAKKEELPLYEKLLAGLKSFVSDTFCSAELAAQLETKLRPHLQRSQTELG